MYIRKIKPKRDKTRRNQLINHVSTDPLRFWVDDFRKEIQLGRSSESSQAVSLWNRRGAEVTENFWVSRLFGHSGRFWASSGWGSSFQPSKKPEIRGPVLLQLNAV